MFYIRPIRAHTADKWHQIANISQLPVITPRPQAGQWLVNAAALHPWSLRAIASYLARRNHPGRSWLQASEEIFTRINKTFTVTAAEWELVPAPTASQVGAFLCRLVKYWLRLRFGLATL